MGTPEGRIPSPFCLSPVILNFLYKHPLPKIHITPGALKFLSSHIPQRKGISLFYNILHDKNSLQMLPPLKKLENYLNKSYPLKQWQIALQSTYKFSKCSNHWQIMLKITHRWHYTPYKLVKVCPNKFPNC